MNQAEENVYQPLEDKGYRLHKDYLVVRPKVYHNPNYNAHISLNDSLFEEVDTANGGKTKQQRLMLVILPQGDVYPKYKNGFVIRNGLLSTTIAVDKFTFDNGSIGYAYPLITLHAFSDPIDEIEPKEEKEFVFGDSHGRPAIPDGEVLAQSIHLVDEMLDDIISHAFNSHDQEVIQRYEGLKERFAYYKNQV